MINEIQNSETPKIIIEYFRTRNRRPGVVVAIGAGIIGWSLCNKKDKYSREKGLEIAIKRAEKAGNLNPAERNQFYYERIPFSLERLVDKVSERSEKYFK